MEQSLEHLCYCDVVFLNMLSRRERYYKGTCRSCILIEFYELLYNELQRNTRTILHLGFNIQACHLIIFHKQLTQPGVELFFFLNLKRVIYIKCYGITCTLFYFNHPLEKEDLSCEPCWEYVLPSSDEMSCSHLQNSSQYLTLNDRCWINIINQHFVPKGVIFL